MIASLQTFVQRRYHLLLMLLITAGFVLIALELVSYKHFRGLQLLGFATPIIGAIVALLGINARGRFRYTLAGVFMVLALAGLVGVFAHNADRFGGEERPAAGAQAEGQQGASTGDDDDAPPQGAPGRGGPGGFRGMEPPPLAPLSLSGFCMLGTVALLGKRDPE